MLQISIFIIYFNQKNKKYIERKFIIFFIQIFNILYSLILVYVLQNEK